MSPEAYEAYLKGRYFWNKRTGDGLKKAIEYFNHAIETDPTYAEAYSGLADSYALSGDWEYGVLSPQDAFPKARAAATKALVLDDSLGEAHASLAFALDLYGWDWEVAETEYKRAIKLKPGYATAHLWYAWHLMVTGRNSEGLSELRKAESLDPLSLIISADMADALCIAHLYDEAVQQSRKHWRWTRTLPSLIMNWGRRSSKGTCMLRQSQSFRERSNFPDIVGPSTPISPTFTLFRDRKKKQ